MARLAHHGCRTDMTRAVRAGYGLDALNLLVARSKTGFGAFVAVYPSSHAWTQAHIGEALSLGTVVAMASQLPAGTLVDRARSKRLVVALAATGAAAAAGVLLLLGEARPVRHENDARQPVAASGLGLPRSGRDNR